MISYDISYVSKSKIEILKNKELYAVFDVLQNSDLGFRLRGRFEECNDVVFESSGIFFWKRYSIFFGEELSAKFNSRSCLYPVKDIWINRMTAIFLGDLKLCDMKIDKDSSKRLCFSLGKEHEELEWIVIGLVLIRLREFAYFPVSGMP